MREKGKYQIQCMKSRSSTGVGMKIDLDYDVSNMRITDSDPDDYAEQQSKYRPTPSAINIMNQIKGQTTLVSTEPIIDQTTGEVLEPENKKVVVDVQGSKLNSLLKNLKLNK
jgi:hypothetical protein